MLRPVQIATALVLMMAATLLAIAPRDIRFRETTGHYYVWITDGMKWNEANEFAKKYSVKFKGITLNKWHLATITDAAENDYVFQVVLNSGKSVETGDTSFLGAIKKDGSVGNFTWVTGEPFIYKNFAPGQPDFARENVLEMGGSWGPQWNDQDGPGSDGEQPHPFILEHEPVKITANR